MQFFWIHLKFTNEILDSQIKPYPQHLTISLKPNWPIDISRLAAIKQLSVSTSKLQYVCGCLLADLFLVWRTSFLFVIKVYIIFFTGPWIELDWLYHKVFIAVALEKHQLDLYYGEANTSSIKIADVFEAFLCS